MQIELHTATNILNEDCFNALPSDTNMNDFFYDEESIIKELETHRLLQIYEQLPDHCIQLCFLS